MLTPRDKLRQWTVENATLIAAEREPSSVDAPHFIEHAELVGELVQMFLAIDEATLENHQPLYSACLFSLDVCVSQLYFAYEHGNKRATQLLNNLMDQLVFAIEKGHHSIHFWLPVVTIFYDARVPLSHALQQAYLLLAEKESHSSEHETFDHAGSMRELMSELSDLSAFELASHFFAQSHAMPPEFFGDLILDLCSIPEGVVVAILSLLHPRAEVRHIVVLALDSVMSALTLDAMSLWRLQTIQTWLPDNYQEKISHWVREQRKKGVLFPKIAPLARLVKIQASEVDGGGAQGLFLQFKQNRASRLGGVLLKDGFGIKDAWTTPAVTVKEVSGYCHEVLADGVTLRTVDLAYLNQMINHFLAVLLQRQDVPGVHFLELQELLGAHFYPESLDVADVMTQLSVQIEPFTEAAIESAFQRTKNWLITKSFAASWFLENERIDRIVNRHCHFADGIKVCHFADAMAAVFEDEMEPTRDQWVFHFLWITLWLKASARKNEKVWQDSFLIAHAIASGKRLQTIPIMQSICHRTVVNSIETMRDRRTHLSQE